METDPEGVRSTLLLQGALDDGRQVLRRRLTRVQIGTFTTKHCYTIRAECCSKNTPFRNVLGMTLGCHLCVDRIVTVSE